MFVLCLVQLFGSRRTEENRLRCWVGVKVFGNELSVFTCEDLYNQIDQLSLSAAGLAVKLLKVHGRWFSQSQALSGCHLTPPTPHIFMHAHVFSLPSFLFVLQGHEVQLNHRAVLMTEELVLPSLSGLPVKLGINMTSLLSLRLKGNVNYRDASHFSLTGYIKPKYIHITSNRGHILNICVQTVPSRV